MGPCLLVFVPHHELHLSQHDHAHLQTTFEYLSSDEIQVPVDALLKPNRASSGYSWIDIII